MKHIIEGNPAQPEARSSLVTVDESSAGQRLDNFLLRQLKGVPKTHVYRIIRSGEVRINKGRASAQTRVEAGDLVRLPPVRISGSAVQKAQSMAVQAAQAPARSFALLHEDEAFLALDKPAGVAVHGGSGVSFGVIEQLRMARPEARYLELVHRLDRETSGVLLVAKKRSALKHLQDQFRERETGKTYLALVLGAWPANKKVLDKPLQKYLLAPSGSKGKVEGDEGERRVRVVARDDPQGMPSLTLVKVRSSHSVAGPDGQPQSCTLLEVTIKTGRTHQIRVHLASEGMPILGDDKYGNFEFNKWLARQGTGLKRMFLHAWRLQCKHPASGEGLELRAELPPELASFLASLPPAHPAIPA